jgi:N-methylhydantoinase A/acetophenone carboxylase
MKFTIDVDTGGTHTHGFIAADGMAKTVTTPTTPHDLTVCLADCLRQAAEAFGVSVKELLLNADIIRYSTTTATNAIIQKTGAKIGLIVTRGCEDSLYAPGGKAAEAVYEMVRKDMITSLTEEIDDKGKIITPLKSEEVIEKMQSLIDKGARTIVVSLRNAGASDVHERKARQIIKEEYPGFYLGSVRVFLSCDVSDQPGDYYRTASTLIDAYVHDILVKYLYKAEDDLRKDGYMHPLMICNSRGGVARVAMTKAIDTYNSGPVAGMCAARNLGRLYGFDNVVTTDIGGTSEDVGLIRDGAYIYESLPRISDVTVNVPMIDVHSVGLAGGSIISLDGSGKIKVGPRSAGARPGPACFNLGGMEPAVTDANVVLGLIDPDYFLGGRMKLVRAKSEAAIQNRIAKKLNVSVPEAAFMIRQATTAAMQQAIKTYLVDKGADPTRLAGYISIVFGGAGPTHYCGFNRGLNFAKTIISPFASPFSAFGSSMADLLHVYSKYNRIELYDAKDYLDRYDKFNNMVDEMYQRALRDIKSEGYSVDNARYFLELVMEDSAANTFRVTTEKLKLNSEAEVKVLCSAFLKERSKTRGGDYEGSIRLLTTLLNATVTMPHWRFQAAEPGSPDPGKALRGEREVFWKPEAGYQKTPIYDRDLLEPGNVVKGPAVIEARDTTYVLPADWVLNIDKYSNAILEEV